jgi:hypothetical protein
LWLDPVQWNLRPGGFICKDGGSEMHHVSIRACLRGSPALAASVVIGFSTLYAGPADATCVSLSNGAPLPAGSTLSLTCETSSSGALSSLGSTQTVNLPTVPGSYFYGNGFGGSTTPLPGSQPSPSAPPSWPASGFGFYDDWVFTIGGASANSITSTIDLGSLQVSDLQVRLYALGGNSLPTLGVPSGGVIDAWSAPISGPGLSGSYSVISPTTLAAGTYVLEVRGNVTGGSGGSYSGVLNMTPVPLPAAAWLLLSGLAGLGAIRRRET